MSRSPELSPELLQSRPKPRNPEQNPEVPMSRTFGLRASPRTLHAIAGRHVKTARNDPWNSQPIDALSPGGCQPPLFPGDAFR